MKKFQCVLACNRVIVTFVRIQIGLLLFCCSLLGPACSFSAQPETPPVDFPEFYVAGHEAEMRALRELFWLHYPGAGPKSTLWDEWLPDAALWPAVESSGSANKMRHAWRQALSRRILDEEGYTATHQHASIAHQLGWPFPFWNQGKRGFGWHFSFKNTVDANWRPHQLSNTDGWDVTAATPLRLTEDGWLIQATNQQCLIAAPVRVLDTFEAPFLQLRWKLAQLEGLEPFLEWRSPADPEFTPAKRMYFSPPSAPEMTYSMVPVYRHPQWTGQVAQVRIGLGNSGSNQVTIQALFTQFDTRHNINAQNFIRGSAKYFWWSGDLEFLRNNINRMRTALRYVMTEHQVLERSVVLTTWVGHNGKSGLRWNARGEKELIAGQGIGNNYWDLLPFGYLDCYATIQYYDALQTMIRLEKEILRHPEWSVPAGAFAFDSGWLSEHAARVKAEGNKLFWNEKTGRYVACLDADGQAHDYGFTFLNCEAIYYGFATPERARTIVDWLDGGRRIEGDTSIGQDIYFWRFGPRATTRRNIEWYMWAWSGPETIPWGGQVQDGGAVLGFSYHDLMARLKTLGPDNTWARLQEVLQWFREVQGAGGYRKYYDGKRPGTLQGGGTAGGLGMDHEFFESVMVPQVMLNGFLGFQPTGDGFSLSPQLPTSWPALKVTKVRLQSAIMSIEAKPAEIQITFDSSPEKPLVVSLPGSWKTDSEGVNFQAGEASNVTSFQVSPNAPAKLVLKKLL